MIVIPNFFLFLYLTEDWESKQASMYYWCIFCSSMETWESWYRFITASQCGQHYTKGKTGRTLSLSFIDLLICVIDHVDSWCHTSQICSVKFSAYQIILHSILSMVQLCRFRKAALDRVIAMIKRVCEISLSVPNSCVLLCDAIVGTHCSLHRGRELACSAISTAYQKK